MSDQNISFTLCVYFGEVQQAHMAHIRKEVHQAGANAALLNIFLRIYVQKPYTYGGGHADSMARQRRCKTVRYTMGKTLANNMHFLWKCGSSLTQVILLQQFIFSFKALHFIIIFLCSYLYHAK